MFEEWTAGIFISKLIIRNMFHINHCHLVSFGHLQKCNFFKQRQQASNLTCNLTSRFYFGFFIHIFSTFYILYTCMYYIMLICRLLLTTTGNKIKQIRWQMPTYHVSNNLFNMKLMAMTFL